MSCRTLPRQPKRPSRIPAGFELREAGSFLLTSFILIFLALLVTALSAGAASRFWDGSANGNLSTSANWVGGVAPVAGDDLVFQAGVSRLAVTNDFSPNRAFNSILFQGSNYILRGSTLLLSNGVNSINPVGPNFIDANVDVRASQAWEAQGPLATLDVDGAISLNANTLTIRANTGDFSFSGVISGTGNLVKTNVGTLRLDGGSANTYSGFTRFDGGVLELNKFGIISITPLVFSNFTAIPGNLFVGDGNGLVNTDVLRLLAPDQIADTAQITIRNSGRFDLGDFDEHVGPLTLQGGTINTGTGTLFLGGPLSTLADDNSALINGFLSLNGATRTITTSSGPAAPDLRIQANISSGGIFPVAGIIKEGGGTLNLSGTNTYSGTTTVEDGQLGVLNDRALGSAGPLSGGTLINGDANLFLSGVQVTNENLTINSANPGGAFNASGASVWTGNILLNTDTFLSSSGSLLLNGTITGAGGFTKINTGSLTLAGINANTYSGTTRVRDGILFLDKDTTAILDGALSGPLIIGEDEVPENADVVRYLACCQLPDDTDITINSSGLLDLNGFGENVRNLIFNGGDVATGAGSILPTGDITVNRNTNSQAIISGRISVLSNPIINVTGHYYSPDLVITAVVHGGGGLTKNGVGEVGLSAANTYTGTTVVNDGFLIVEDSLALGSIVGGTVVNSGAVLALNFNVAVPAEPLTLAGAGQSGFGALSSSYGSNSWAGPITLSANATIGVDTSDFLNLSGSVTGSFDITKTETGTLLFTGAAANSFNDFFVNAGTVIINKSLANSAGPAEITIGDGSGTDIVRLINDNQIADSARIHISISGRLDLNDQSETTGSIDGRGLIDLRTGTLRAGADNNSATFSGLIVGTGSVFKLGTGSWELRSDNTYSGNTTVSAGTLFIDGNQDPTDVTVNGTATLGGSGRIGNLQVFGSLAPGHSPGILTCSNVNFASQADYFVELNGGSPGAAVGGYDQLSVRGTNQLGNSTLHLSAAPSFAPMEGDRLTIINNDGSEAIRGNFIGLANGSVLTVGGLQLRILYSDIFLNDVVLVVTNTALKLGADPVVETGNGNGEIEPGECNLLRIALLNKIGGTVSGVTATLSSTNPDVTVTQPNSAYPNLPPNGTQVNTTPFQISTAPTMLCGTNLDLTLIVHTATNGTFTIPVRLFTGTAGTPTRLNQTLDLAIPDTGTANSTLNVAGFAGVLGRVAVSLHISHTAIADLSLSLIAPDGTIVDLSSNNGGTGNDYGAGEADADRTTFTDLALTSVVGGTAPYRGSFRPEQPLKVFRGMFGSDVNGTWILRISDNAGGTLGTLRAWSLFLSPTVCLPGGGECDPPCPGCPVRLDIAADPTSANQVLLKWSTAAIGFNLVGTNTLKNPPNAFGPIGPSPVVIGGKFTVTNSVVGGARFYELRKP
jgi:autotransporter-associated beta strand protein